MIFGKIHEYQPVLLEFFDEDVLEEKIGGTKPNITENFFPPRF